MKRTLFILITIAMMVPELSAQTSQTLSSSLGMYVFPAKDQTKEVQDADEAACYNWAKDIFNRPISVIRLALNTFLNLNMIEIDGNGVINLINFEKHQNIEGLEKVRELARSRQQQRRLRLTNANNVLIRDSYTCQYCGDSATGIDHITPISAGGGEDDLNKVACCRRCNGRKMIQDVVSFLNNPVLQREGWLRHDLIQNNIALKTIIKPVNNNLYQYVTLQLSDVTQQIKIRLREDKSRADEEKESLQILINEKRYDEVWIGHEKLSTIIRCLTGEQPCMESNKRLYREQLLKLNINLLSIGVNDS